MLFKLFKSNHPYVIFLIPILGIALWIPSLFDFPIEFPVIETKANTLLYKWLTDYLISYPKISSAIALLLLILQSFIIIRLNFTHIFIENKTYLPSVLFVVFGSLFVSHQHLHPALISNFFLLWALDKALVIEKEQNRLKRYFESGFFLGFGALFFPNSYVFIPIIWLTLIILRNSRWREWTSNLIGFIVPAALYLSIMFLYDKNEIVIQNFQQIISSPFNNFSFSSYALIPIGIIFTTSLIAILTSLRYIGIKKISTRKYFTFFFWFLILTILLFYFHPSIGLEIIYILAIPLSILAALFYTETRSKWAAEILFSLTILAAFALIWIH